jgi:hypothetical protein
MQHNLRGWLCHGMLYVHASLSTDEGLLWAILYHVAWLGKPDTWLLGVQINHDRLGIGLNSLSGLQNTHPACIIWAGQAEVCW